MVWYKILHEAVQQYNSIDVSVTLRSCVRGFAGSNVVRDSDCSDTILEVSLGPCVLMCQADGGCLRPNVSSSCICHSITDCTN